MKKIYFMDMKMTMSSATFNDLDPQDVLEFLRRNPDFLQAHPELISTLSDEVRNAGSNIVDFQQLMVHKLRQDKQRAEDRQRLLVDNVRSNMTIQARMHAGVVRMLEARDLDELTEIISSELSLMLEVDAITISLESLSANDKNTTFNGIRIVEPHFVDNHLGSDRDTVLQANVTGDPRLFGSAARLIKSHALIRLHIAPNMPEALIAFGSRDPLLFANGQGTELVGFLGAVIERLLRQHINTLNKLR